MVSLRTARSGTFQRASPAWEWLWRPTPWGWSGASSHAAQPVERTVTTLRFFLESEQGPEPEVTGYRGFYYHFVDVRTGRRAWKCELSTIDTAILLAGALTSAAYFDGTNPEERELRGLAKALYERVDWQWAQNRGATVAHAWTPERGFLPHRWEGYNEALLLCSANATYPDPRRKRSGWLSSAHFALDQGPVILMIENYRTGLIWRLMRSCPPIVRGLRRAGFAGGWLG